MLLLLQTIPKFCLSGLVVEILTRHPATTEGDVLIEDAYIQRLPSNHVHEY